MKKKLTIEDVAKAAHAVGATISVGLKPRDTFEELKYRSDLHDFIEWLCAHGEDPSNWPLTQQEQIAFVRSSIYRARKIKTSEAFLLEAVDITSKQMALSA